MADSGMMFELSDAQQNGAVIKVIGIGGVISCIGAYCFSISIDFETALLSRILMGSGLSCAFISLSAIVGRWFPIYQFAMMIAAAEVLGLLIAAISEQLLPGLFAAGYWRLFYQCVGFAALVLATMVLIFMPDHDRSVRVLGLKQGIGQVLRFIKVKCLWVNGMISGVLFALITGFIAGDAMQMLGAMPNMTHDDAGLLCAATLYGVVFGAAWVSYACLYYDMQKILKATIGCSLISAVALLGFIWLPADAFWLRFAMGLIMGFFSASYLFSFRFVSDYLEGGEGKSILMGFTNMLSVMVGPIAMIVVGILQRVVLEFRDAPILTDKLHAITYQVTSSVFVLLLLFGAVLARQLLINEKKT